MCTFPKSGSWRIEVKEDPDPLLARVLIADKWDGKPEEAKKLLESILENWPKDRRVKFILTCGGFVQFNWPKGISREDIGNNREPNAMAVKALVAKAEEYARYVISNNICEKLADFTDFITLGIDSYKQEIPVSQNYIGQPHIELVFLVDLKKGCVRAWTGKSYPTAKQQKGLVRISNLRTHFELLENLGKIMILGCHDLNLFNNRNWRNTGKWRKGIKTKFRTLAHKEKPIYVLHHPHTTVNKRTWRNAWSGLRTMLPSVEQFAGAGRYYEPCKEPPKWDSLQDVREATKCEGTNTIDFICTFEKTH